MIIMQATIMIYYLLPDFRLWIRHVGCGTHGMMLQLITDYQRSLSY
jgi:hypothetical protein